MNQLAKKVGAHVTDVKDVAVWGNHSPTMYADITHATVKGDPALGLVDQAWINEDFIPTVAKRGSAIIAARGASSAASAASAAIDHMHDWALGSRGEWVTMGVPSDGSYGIPEGLVFGFPWVIDEAGNYSIVQGLDFTEEGKARIAKTTEELLKERQAVKRFFA